jgi:predicted Holliday junction resolvase-like endonuclease
MDSSIIFTIFISIAVIVIAHYSYQLLRDNLTQKKDKDLVGFQSKKLDEIMQELKEIKEQKQDVEEDLADYAQEVEQSYL